MLRRASRRAGRGRTVGDVPSTTPLVVAAAVHAGFQLAVSTLVYPALADEPPDRFAAAHRAHSRRITPLVTLVYAGVIGSAAPVLAPDRGGRPEPAAIMALAAQAVALGTTALVAAPLHGRLGRARTDDDLRRLRRADLVRTTAAVVGLAAAVGARRRRRRPALVVTHR